MIANDLDGARRSSSRTSTETGTWTWPRPRAPATGWCGTRIARARSTATGTGSRTPSTSPPGPARLRPRRGPRRVPDRRGRRGLRRERHPRRLRDRRGPRPRREWQRRARLCEEVGVQLLLACRPELHGRAPRRILAPSGASSLAPGTAWMVSASSLPSELLRVLPHLPESRASPSRSPPPRERSASGAPSGASSAPARSSPPGAPATFGLTLDLERPPQPDGLRRGRRRRDLELPGLVPRRKSDRDLKPHRRGRGHPSVSPPPSRASRPSPAWLWPLRGPPSRPWAAAVGAARRQLEARGRPPLQVARRPKWAEILAVPAFLR